ncbi:hypothetical protein Zm00014a_041422 [Zea mays]|uniref:BED-type domain-containing protein n=1 Tax=Zea mays TaxID=4577 RepID=A0A3L6FU38_MAIZE|nr:hypothetical protein Zm00014a_041422 [Zea mays]
MEGVSSAPEMDEAISTDQSSRSTKRRAKVWDHVDSELIDGKEKAVCKYCKAHLSSAAGKGTTHLNRHISVYCHAIPPEERQRFLATQKTKPDVAHVFDPVVFRGLIAKYAVQQHHECPTEEDWSKAEALHGFLQEFSDATKAFSVDRHPIAHLFLKMLLVIRVVDNVDMKMRELKRYLKKYYLEYEKIMRSHSLHVFITPDDQMRSEPMTGKRMFDSDDEEYDWEI